MLSLFCSHAFSQNNFYVSTTGSNANVGSQLQPWLTIQFGVDQLIAGDTLNVSTGTYPETVLFDGNADSGSVNNWITLISNNAVIDGTGLTPVDRQGLITIRNASYIIVDGFELRNFKTSNGTEITDSPVGILIDGSSTNIDIVNNTIHDIQNRSTCGQSTDCGPGANGIAVYGDTVSGITDILLENNEVYNNVLSASESFTINGNVDRFMVINNFVHDNNNIAFDFIGYEDDVCSTCTDENNRVRNGFVQGNRAINNSIKLSVGGFPTNPWYENDDGNAGGFYVDGGRNIIFDGNYSSQNDMGFEFASEHSGKSSEDILMINNFIYDNREVGISIGGYAESNLGEGGGSAKRIYIYNNSFYHNQGWGTEINFAFRVIDFNASNNVFFGTGLINDNFAEEANGQHNNISWTNNIWWASNNSNTSQIPGTFAVVDPQFIDPNNGNLNLVSTSTLIDDGTVQNNISTWTSPFWQEIFNQVTIPVHGNTDINSELRIEGLQIDIGADEFGTTLPTDNLIFTNGFE